MKNETGLVKMSWNTGRSYSAEGQRLAAQKIGDDVLFVDYDRMLSYWIPNCKLDKQSIMDRYDSNQVKPVPNNKEYRDIIKDLEEYVLTAPAIPFQAAS